jgi:outer membrane biogenesis lipoprotein LolB
LIWCRAQRNIQPAGEGWLKMSERLMLCALALSAALLPACAMADDPNDPTMQTSPARTHDRATVRRLNQNQLDYVRHRDAGYAQDQKQYLRQMAEWRRAVAACRAGDYSACDH